jgi:DNA-binding NarL/FixJ family response regulator
MAEATSIEQWREARLVHWRRALLAYGSGAAAYRQVMARSAARRASRLDERAAAARPPALAVAHATVPGAPAVRDRTAGQLTARQLEVASLVAEGLTNRQIARRLTVTEGTVANHVRATMLRLGAHCRAQVAVWYVARRD